jgi:hypothetical protein
VDIRHSRVAASLKDIMRRASVCVAILWPLVFAACGRCGARPAGTDATGASIPEASPPSEIAGEDAGADAGAEHVSTADAGCGPTLLQPDICAPPHADLDLDNDAIQAWFNARGVAKTEYTFAHCRQIVFGPEKEQVLVCVDMKPLAIDRTLGIEGPVEHRYDLDVVTARDGRRVELLRVPFAFGMSSTSYSTTSELLFTARYTVDAAAGTLDVLASAEECTAALAMLKPHWDAQNAELREIGSIPPPFKASLLRANELERASDAERIRATCRAAGHYVRATDGRLAKAAK